MSVSDNPTRGGARKGAGRKAVVQGDDVRKILVSIDAPDRAFLRAIGEGVLSRGIQIATDIARRHVTGKSIRRAEEKK